MGKRYITIGLVILVVAVISIFVVQQYLLRSEAPLSQQSNQPNLPQLPQAKPPEQPNVPAGYPQIFEVLPEAEQEALTLEFRVLNNDEICNTIDQFGFVGEIKYNDEWGKSCYDSSTTIMSEGKLLKDKITNENRIIEMAKETLVKNSKFAGVLNKDDLLVDDEYGGIWPNHCIDTNGYYDGACMSNGSVPTVLRIRFKNQVYNGLEVKNTNMITVRADSKKVYKIDGHWYGEIKIPLTPQISESDVKSKLVGKELTFYDIAGRPRTSVVSPDDNPAKLVILPHYIMPPTGNIPERIELRLCWEVPLDGGMWRAYMDAITGEEIEIKQMFVT